MRGKSHRAWFYKFSGKVDNMSKKMCALWAVFASTSLVTHCLGGVEVQQDYLQEHLKKGMEWYEQGDWRRAADELERVPYFFPDTPEAGEASFYLGVCYWNRKELDFANQAFSDYLRYTPNPEKFQEVIEYKFTIAEEFVKGSRRRPFRCRYFPKWFPGKDLALGIYDEVIAAVPTSQLAARSLMAKGDLLLRFGDFKASVEAYQALIRSFPKDSLTPIAFVGVGEAYLGLAKIDPQNPDLLALADLNRQKFQEAFPGEARVEQVAGLLQEMQELYAKELYRIGRMYERKGQPQAANVYYSSLVEQFPDTQVAAVCRAWLEQKNPGSKEQPQEDLTEEPAVEPHQKAAAHYYEKGWWREAASELEQLQQTSIHPHTLHYPLAICYFQLQEHGMARREFLAALQTEECEANERRDILEHLFRIAQATEEAGSRYLFPIRQELFLPAQQAAFVLYGELATLVQEGEEEYEHRALAYQGQLLEKDPSLLAIAGGRETPIVETVWDWKEPKNCFHPIGPVQVHYSLLKAKSQQRRFCR